MLPSWLVSAMTSGILAMNPAGKLVARKSELLPIRNVLLTESKNSVSIESSPCAPLGPGTARPPMPPMIAPRKSKMLWASQLLEPSAGMSMVELPPAGMTPSGNVPSGAPLLLRSVTTTEVLRPSGKPLCSVYLVGLEQSLDRKSVVQGKNQD